MIFPDKRQVVLSVILSLLWVTILHWLGSDHHTFAGKWKDNVSNISSAFIFKEVGLDIYRFPTEKLLDILPGEEYLTKFPKSFEDLAFFTLKNTTEPPLFIVWGNVPRPYPLGAWLVYGPFAYLFYGLDFSLSTTTLLLALFFLLMAHISFFIFLRIFNECLPSELNRFSKGLKYFALTFCYYEFVRWSCQGQYDLFSMFFLLQVFHFIKEDRYPKALLFYGLSLFFHFRPLLYAGLIFLIIGRMVLAGTSKNGILRKEDLPLNLLSAGLGLLALVVFWWNLGYATDSEIYTNNYYSFYYLPKQGPLKLIYYFTVTWGIVLWLLFTRKWTMAATLTGINLMFMTTPLMRGWYVMFVFPIFLLLEPESKNFRRDLVTISLAYIFLASTYPNQSPFDLTFIKELFRLVQGTYV